MMMFSIFFALVLIWLISIYNRLTKMRNFVKNAFSQIEVQLKRRYDLIPNLVESVKGYLKHEASTMEAVIKARNQAFAAAPAVAKNPSDGNAMKNLIDAEAGLSQALGKLMVVSEAYPELKANTNILTLMEELTSTENKISFARQAFNDAVMSYNNDREIFPNNILADQFGFSAATSFEVANPTEKEPVKISFG